MIPADYLAEWRQHVPWVPSSQVEQDLVLSSNLAGELQDRVFKADLGPLLAPDVEWDLDRASRFVLDEIAPRLSGEAWKGL